MSQYDDAKNRFIKYLGLFANDPRSFQMMSKDITVETLTWACISTWSNFHTENTDLHIILNAWQVQDTGHQQFLRTQTTERNQSNDAAEMFNALLTNTVVMEAVGRLNEMLNQHRSNVAAMSDRCHELIQLIHSSSSTIEKFTVAEHVEQTLASLPLPEYQRVFLDAAHNPYLTELESAKRQEANARQQINLICPQALKAIAYDESLKKIYKELMRSFSFFRNQQAEPLFEKYLDDYNTARNITQLIDACAADYKLVNDLMDWRIASRNRQTDLAFDQWQALKVLEEPTPPPVVVASQDLQAEAQAANAAAAAASEALVHASVSPSPSRNRQTDLAFDQWQALKVLEEPTPPPVVVASQDLQAEAQAANAAAAAASEALVHASVSPSPSRAPSASGSPSAAGSQVGPAGSVSIAPSRTSSTSSTSSGSAGSVSIAPSRTSSTSSRSSLGSVAASVVSDQVPTPATPATPLSPFTASVPHHGGGKKKTRSNHKRSAHKHKRSAHKHKRSAHKRSAHKRSARKHKKL